MAVREKAAARHNGVVNAATGNHGAYGLITRAQAFGNGNDVGHDAVFGASKQMPCSPHAGPDLVQNTQHAVAVANFAYSKLGIANVLTPVTNAHLVSRLLLITKKHKCITYTTITTCSTE